MDGNKKWQTNVGKDSGRQRWGSSSSPVLYKDTVIVTASDESETLFGLDAATGKEKWKQQAGGLGGVWGTPALAEGPKGTELVLAVPQEIWGFNPETGKLRWYSRGNGGANHSVIVDKDVVYSIGGGRSGANGVAVKVGGKGEVKDEDLIWDVRASGRFASPVYYKSRIYSVDNGILRSLDAKTGKKIIEKRLPASSSSSQGRAGGRGRFGGADYASPIVAGGKLYIVTSAGRVHVAETGDEFKVLATNDLTFDTSGFNASPAASDGTLVIRSNSSLYCISE